MPRQIQARSISLRRRDAILNQTTNTRSIRHQDRPAPEALGKLLAIRDRGVQKSRHENSDVCHDGSGALAATGGVVHGPPRGVIAFTYNHVGNLMPRDIDSQPASWTSHGASRATTAVVDTLLHSYGLDAGVSQSRALTSKTHGTPGCPLFEGRLVDVYDVGTGSIRCHAFLDTKCQDEIAATLAARGRARRRGGRGV